MSERTEKWNLREAEKDVQRSDIKALMLSAALAKNKFYEAMFQLEELTGKEVSPNNAVIQGLVEKADAEEFVHVTDELLNEFLEEIKDSPLTCADGSCSIQHNEGSYTPNIYDGKSIGGGTFEQGS